jgi:hypothetical protein
MSDTTEMILNSPTDKVDKETTPSKPFEITRSMATALRRLRKKAGTAKIWIDAICINQNNLQERAEQVSIMVIPYSQAKTVHFWLGQGDPTIEAALPIDRRRDRENVVVLGLEN